MNKRDKKLTAYHNRQIDFFMCPICRGMYFKKDLINRINYCIDCGQKLNIIHNKSKWDKLKKEVEELSADDKKQCTETHFGDVVGIYEKDLKELAPIKGQTTLF